MINIKISFNRCECKNHPIRGKLLYSWCYAVNAVNILMAFQLIPNVVVIIKIICTVYVVQQVHWSC